MYHTTIYVYKPFTNKKRHLQNLTKNEKAFLERACYG